MEQNNESLVKYSSPKKYMLLQPNNITFGRYSITAVQDNVLTLIIEQLQKFMQLDKMQFDLMGLPYVEISSNSVLNGKHKKIVLNAIEALGNKDFTFRWTTPDAKNVKTSGKIIIATHDYERSSAIGITLNPWAIPFLIYYGKGVGGTYFKKHTALSLKGEKAKRIYKLICGAYNLAKYETESQAAIYEYPMELFKKDFELGDSYTNAVIKKRILEPAKKEIDKQREDIWFDYELVTKHKQKGKKKQSADTINFYIHKIDEKVRDEQEKTLYRWLRVLIKEDFKVDETFTIILGSENSAEYVDRVNFWDLQYKTQEITRKHLENKIKYVLREDFNIEI